MKISIISGMYFDKPCLRVIAKIRKSPGNGILRSHQKTWRVVLDLNINDADVEAIKAGATAQAKRWEQEVFLQIKREKDFHDSIAAEVAAAKENIATLSGKPPTPPTSDQPASPA